MEFQVGEPWWKVQNAMLANRDASKLHWVNVGLASACFFDFLWRDISSPANQQTILQDSAEYLVLNPPMFVSSKPPFLDVEISPVKLARLCVPT